MSYILSSGIQVAEHSYSQSKVKSLIKELFPLKPHEINRLLPVFEHANIEERQFAMDLEWFQSEHGLSERNQIYHEKAIEYAKDAINTCLSNTTFLKREVHSSEVDHVIFVSSTGISTPTIDAYLINEMKMKDSVKRTPIFGLGCAGGTSGVAKSYEYLKGHPEENVLIVCVELCSLTFQHNDPRVSNFVGTALFGDGASAVLMIGEKSPLRDLGQTSLIEVSSSSSRIKPDSTDVMGWRVVDSGFEVIFNKSIPRLVKDFWYNHMRDVLQERGVEVQQLPFIIAHPGGRKVLEGYQEVFNLPEKTLEFSRDVLRKHGNMSSPTVHFVLNEAMKSKPAAGTKSFMTSLGPGFSSEIVSLEWM
ncbi:type III polyketide synthase [Halobacillus sp. BBL2006]|uniref:type III polyketide synthase n=1 Tax=Halobacillus sp. BBL2006 TaxID=1543706 RepID=UPI000543EF10|nr:3-oxoacyl-[acyl-carrier-protein] synthase III C-terminal domain-containing protein [Halobacillus sp. BBL2006]KHE69693.1 naringenin-chalcone synthase [Halobacillus sp. BBL2006]